MTRTTRHAALAIILAAGFATVAHAQCGGVIIDPEQGHAFVSDSGQESVHTATRWDPDGDGPEPAWLVVAGQFKRAATQISNYVVAWDGKQWHAMDEGLQAPTGGALIGAIADVVNLDGTLVALGNTSAFSTSRVMHWTGESWQQFGAPVLGSITPGYADITLHGGDLYVAGAAAFMPTPTSTVSASPVIRRVGESWEPLGSRLYGGNARMTHLESAPNGLFGAGDFTGVGTTSETQIVLNNVGLWNGTQWIPLGEGLNGAVRDTAYADGQLYVIGTFTQSGSTPLSGIARWDGTQWSQVGDSLISTPLAIDAHNGEIYVATRDQDSVTRVLRLDGASWTEVARPGQSPDRFIVGGASVSRLVSDPDGLLILGRFVAVSNLPASGAAILKPDQTVRTLGAGFIWSTRMVDFNGRLIADTSFRAGDEPVINFAQWDGREWSDAGMPARTGTLAAAGSRLLSFVNPNNTNDIIVQQLENANWSALSGTFQFESGLNRTLTFAEFNGELYAAGPFGSIDGRPIKGLARWDDAEWRQVGGGLDWTGTTRTGHSLAIVDDNLYVSGSFDRVGGQVANGLARWDGTTLVPLFDPDIMRPVEIANWNGDLIGHVRISTPSGSAYVVSRFDGDRWSTIAAIPPGDSPGGGFLGRLLPVGDSLWALYQQIPSTAYIIKLNSESNWEQVGETIVLDPSFSILPRNFSADALVFNNEIHVFGDFSRQGDHVANNWARVSADGVPLIVTQPDDVITSCGSPVELRAIIANGYDADGSLEHQWYLNGNALSETQFTRGVNTDTLTIPALAQPFTGIYTLAVTNSCGTATSRQIFVSGDTPDCRACSPCAADFDFDGGVTGEDVAAFFTAYETNAPCADVDSSGGVDGSDLAVFFSLYEAGGC